MADRKISDLTALTTPASGDYVPIVDISEVAAASKNKRITIEELMRGMPDGTAAAPGIAFETDPNTGIYSPGADQLAVSTGGTGRLFVDASGSVGIGTSALATVPLLLNDTGNGLVLQNAASGNYAIGLLAGTGSQDAYIYQRANAPLIIGTNNAERARIDSSGRLLVGTSSASGGYLNNNSLVHVQAEAASAGITIHRPTSFSALAGPYLIFSRSRGTPAVIVESGDTLGSIEWGGADGTDVESTAALIRAEVDGTPGANDMPGRLVFSVTADGAASPTEALRISNDRSITVSDGGHVVLGSSTGTKIGTATTQKIGLWNATPVVQPAAVANIAVTFTANAPAAADGALTVADGSVPTVTELLEYCVELEAKLEDLLGKLRTVGIIAT